MDITVLKVPDKRGVFFAKEAPSSHASSGAKNFAAFMESVNEYLNDDQVVSNQATQFGRGQFCYGRLSSDKTWYRVQIDNVVLTKNGYQANCVMVDFAKNTLIPVQWLREPNSHFWDVPFQAQEFTLHGVVPITMYTNPDTFDVERRPAKTWDTAACDYLTKTLQEHSAKVDVVCREPQTERKQVRLYLSTPTESLCLNDELVRLQYAMYASTSDHTAQDNVSTEEKAQMAAPSKLTGTTKERQEQRYSQHLQEICNLFKADAVSATVKGDAQNTDRQGLLNAKNTFTTSLMPERSGSPDPGEWTTLTAAIHHRSSSRLQPGSSLSISATPKGISGTDVPSTVEGDVSRVSGVAGPFAVGRGRPFPVSALAHGCHPRLTSSSSDVGFHPLVKPNTPSNGGIIPQNPSKKRGKALLAAALNHGSTQSIPAATVGLPSSRPAGDLNQNKSVPASNQVSSLIKDKNCAGSFESTKAVSRFATRQLPVNDLRAAHDEKKVLAQGNNKSDESVDDKSLVSQSVFAGSPPRKTIGRGMRLLLASTSPEKPGCRSKVGNPKHVSSVEKTLESLVMDNVKLNSVCDSGMDLEVEASLEAQTCHGKGPLPLSPPADVRPKNLAAKSHAENVVGSSRPMSRDLTVKPDEGMPAGIKTLAGGKLSARLPKHLMNEQSQGPQSQLRLKLQQQQYQDKQCKLLLQQQQHQQLQHQQQPSVVDDCAVSNKHTMTVINSLPITSGTKEPSNFKSKVFSSSETMKSTANHVCEVPTAMLVDLDNFDESAKRSEQPRVPEVVETEPSAKPLKSILKSKCSSVYFTDSDSEHSPRLRTNKRKSVSYSSSDSEEHHSSPGNRLLHGLTSDLSSKLAAHNWIKPEIPGVRGHHDGILVHGDGVPNPITSLEKASHFPDSVKKILLEADFPGPTAIQSYSWPCIFRGSDLVGIAPPNKGKTLAYLLPLLSQVIRPANYAEMPPGTGPYVLVISPCWKKACAIYDEFKKYDKNCPNVRTRVVFGGGAEESQAVTLINGCEILVATPHCLLRILKKQYTSLQRLCHIVLDDADVLTDQFRGQIKEIMASFVDVLRDEPERFRSTPRQTMVFSSQWTEGVESFFFRYLQDPVTIIASKFEAAIYGKVKQNIVMCRTAQEQSLKLISLVDQLQGCCVLVFTSPHHAEDVYHLLHNHGSFNVWIATEKMTSTHFSDLRFEWETVHQQKSKPVLVLTDECVSELQIRDADCVIHYDIPDLKSDFGKRLACMAKNYKVIEVDNKNFKPGGLSYIMVTSRNADQALTLVHLLDRLKEPVPAQLRAMVNGILEGKEESRCGSLCLTMKAFGQCLNKMKCTDRHLISSEFDDPTKQRGVALPREGEVKVLITHVATASCYFVRLQEHRDLEGETHRLNVQFAQLDFDMKLHFGKQTNKRLYACGTPPVVGDLCAYEARSGTFHRVQVVKVLDDGKNYSDKLEVSFVDLGRSEVVELSRLYILPNTFVSIPYQAVQVFICRVKPMDLDPEWTPRADKFVFDLISGKDMDGKIVLSLGGCLWLDPLVERVRYKYVRIITNKFNVRRELLRNGLALDNKEHIDLLKAACQGKIDLPEVPEKEDADNSGGQLELADTQGEHDFAILAENKDFHSVYVSAVTSPELFFVQTRELSTALEEMMDEINSNVVDTTAQVSYVTGQLCLAKFPVDDRWYRAQVMSHRDDQVQVFFVDYGDYEPVSRDTVCALPAQYHDFPFQAIECSLANVTSPEGSWSEADGDALWELTRGQDDFQKWLMAKVAKKTGSLYAGIQRFYVDLFDTTGTEDVNIRKELIQSGHARYVPECDEDVFPEAVETRKHYDYPYQKIPDLCAFMRQTQAVEKRLEVAKVVLGIVVKSTNFKDEMRVAGCVTALCEQINQEDNYAVLEQLVFSLIYMSINNVRNCDEIHKMDGIKTLCECLKETEDPNMISCFSWALKYIALNDRMRSAIRMEGGVDILCTLLKSSVSDRVADEVIWALAALTAECLPNCQAVKFSDGIQCLRTVIESTGNDTVLTGATTIIGTMASYMELRDMLRKEGIIPVIAERLSKTDSEKFVQASVKAFKNLANNSRANKEAMLNCGLLEVIETVVNDGITTSDSVRKLLLDMRAKLKAEKINRLAVLATPQRNGEVSPSPEKTVPPELVPVLLSRGEDKTDGLTRKAVPLPIPVGACSQLSGNVTYSHMSYPTVQWSQNPHRCLLSIKLRGVKEANVSMEPSAIHFSSVLGSTHYNLDLDLFDSLDVHGCRYCVLGSEVLLSLKKTKKVRWPRLLRDKHKLPFILVDHERYIDSSSDTDADDSDVPFVLTRKNRNRLPTKIGVPKSETYVPEHSEESCSEDASGEESSDTIYDDHDRRENDVYDIFS